jgi:hypothetical protein
MPKERTSPRHHHKQRERAHDWLALVVFRASCAHHAVRPQIVGVLYVQVLCGISGSFGWVGGVAGDGNRGSSSDEREIFRTRDGMGMKR